MTSVKQSLNNWATIGMLIAAFIGFGDAAYLTREHYLGVLPPCALSHGCGAVLASPFSSLLGIPLSLFGAVFYLTMILLLVLFLDTKKPAWLKWVKRGSYLGIIVSA